MESGTIYVNPSLAWQLVMAFLIVYPIALLLTSMTFRTPLSASAVPATLTPLFAGLTAACAAVHALQQQFAHFRETIP